MVNKLTGTAHIARNAAIWREYAAGATQLQLADKYGLSQPAIHHIVKDARAELIKETLAEKRQALQAQLDHLRHMISELAEKPLPPLVGANGKVVTHQGEVLLDQGPKVQAALAAVKIGERLARLIGADAPTQVDVAVEQRASDAAVARAAEALARVNEDE